MWRKDYTVASVSKTLWLNHEYLHNSISCVDWNGACHYDRHPGKHTRVQFDYNRREYGENRIFDRREDEGIENRNGQISDTVETELERSTSVCPETFGSGERDY